MNEHPGQPCSFIHSVAIFEGLLITSPVHPGKGRGQHRCRGDTAGEAACEGKERLSVPIGKVVET